MVIKINTNELKEDYAEVSDFLIDFIDNEVYPALINETSLNSSEVMKVTRLLTKRIKEVY